MIHVTGTRDTSTNPVSTVPRIAPTVPTPDREPTTAPVSSSRRSLSLVTMGVTAESNQPGTMIAAAAATTRNAPPANEAEARRRKGVAATTTPETPSRVPSRARPSRSSAHRPPTHEPPAMAARASPMTRVLVSRVSPK